ncbi:MAG TPA: exonuclease domain-containing protein, partial [Clostridia bacterium]|nr:exonuclease domain-containing protein [Clostridia bacterium]
FHRFVNPYRPIPLEVTQLTGITEEMVRDEKNIFEVLTEVLPFIGNSIIVGHHIGFDMTFMNLKLKRYCKTRLYNPCCDTMIIGSAFYPEMRAHTLNRLLLMHDLEPVARHTAIGDARLTAKLFVIFLQLLREYKINTYDEMASFIRQKSYLNQKISF